MTPSVEFHRAIALGLMEGVKVALEPTCWVNAAPTFVCTAASRPVVSKMSPFPPVLKAVYHPPGRSDNR